MSNGHGRSTEGFGISRDQSVNLIVKTCLENGVTNPRQIAYILATAQHETRNFTAPEEDFGRSQARKLGYRGGEEYFGRGYVHLTHKDNYEQMDRLLGLQGALVRDPSLATDPQVAAKIMVVGMRDGLFTSRPLGRYIDSDSTDFYNARRTVNGVVPSKPWSVKAAHECERYAQAWEQRVPAIVEAATRSGVSFAPDASGPRNPTAGSDVARTDPPPSLGTTRSRPVAAGAGAIYTEAYQHFMASGNRYEYGRPDTTSQNREGNRRTDGSRNERDLDGDGLKGVDCSSFVWRGLKNAGYDVPATPFTTHALFRGSQITGYARENFGVVPASEARRDNGALQPGDILLFKDRNSSGQHVGIFKGYNAQGQIQFIGSQVRYGPAQAEAGRGSYWNGGEFEIVGALRAKPEFQIRAPLHASARQPAPAGRAAAQSNGQTPAGPAPAAQARAADADGVLQLGEKGPAVSTLQRRLADLGYRGKDGRLPGVDGEFGDNTKTALQAFQREHGLAGRGVAGQKTEAALDRAERSLMSHTSHPHHALYAQVLERLQGEERARGTRSGHHSERIAAALAVECVREGITRVDRIELNRDATLVRAVQVSPMRDESGLNRSTDGISPAQAARQPMLESSEQIHQVAVNRQAREHDARQQQQPQQSPPRAVPAM